MIEVNQVRLIDSAGEQRGIVPINEALAMARNEGLDLVEVATDADPTVCRIMDFGRYKYVQSKKQQESKRKQTIILVKEIKIRPKTDEHDYQFKLRNIRRFLEEKNKAKVTLRFRGREIAFANLAKAVLDRIVKDTADLGTVEQMPKLEGRTMVMVLAPK